MLEAQFGNRVLAEVVERARLAWRARLLGAYALGSLAHGGFSAQVSDVDVALVLEDPLQSGDSATVEQLLQAVKAGRRPLADRVSIFWGSPRTLSGAQTGGRLEPQDLLDLAQYGRLEFGKDLLRLWKYGCREFGKALRSQVRLPTRRELVVSSGACALQRLSAPQVLGELRCPARLARADAKTLTKRVLFPARFLYTARTGEVGINQRAAEHFAGSETGPAAELVRQALAWRTAAPQRREQDVADLLRNGILPLYRVFVGEYEKRLRAYGELELAQAYLKWRRALA